MKKSTIMIFALLIVSHIIAQENNVFTKSVQIENFIPYVVNSFKVAKDSSVVHNITFLIPATASSDITERHILLKQGFRLLSDKLGENDKITLIAYSGLNGEFLPRTSAKGVKKILYALNNIETGIKLTVEDGIQLGYDKADENFDATAINTVVLIRDSNISTASVKTDAKKSKKNKKEKRVKSNAILLTIISLAPEVLRILKDK